MKLKKVLAATLAGTMVMASVSTAFAATSMDDVTSTGFWEGHTSSIEVADGSTVTITFTQTSDSDSADNWDSVLYDVYTANEAYDSTGDTAHNNIDGYTEYWVCRADVYGWIGDYNSADTETLSSEAGITFTIDSAPEDWATWLEGCVAGQSSTVVASLSGSSLTVVYTVGDAQSTSVITVDSSKPVYIGLTGEKTTITNISYDVETGSTTTTSDSSETATTTEKTTQAGDAAPVAAVAVALLGCAAIAFASKKKMA